MSTLFVERSGACVGGEALVSEDSLIKVRTALPEGDRARLHWVAGYVGKHQLASDEIREMGMWMDLFGHAREVGIDMAQIRSFIDGARGERFLQKHEMRSGSGDSERSSKNGFQGKGRNGNGNGASATDEHVKKRPPAEKKTAHRASPSVEPKRNGAKVLHVRANVMDLDPRRRRSGQVIEIGDKHVKIKWESGRVNEISLDRLMTPRLFSVR